MSFFAAWLLSALASVVLGAIPPPTGKAPSFAVPVAGAIAGVLFVSLHWVVSPTVLACAVIALTLFELARPRNGSLPRFGAAMIAVQTGELLTTASVPPPIALAVGAAVALLPTWLQRGSAQFTTVPMHEEALLILLALALICAAAPEIASGWHSAAALNANAPLASTAVIPLWAFGVLGAAVVVGCASQLARRSRGC